MAEKMITLGKSDTLHARRQALRIIYKKNVVKKLFDDLGPRFSERKEENPLKKRPKKPARKKRISCWG